MAFDYFNTSHLAFGSKLTRAFRQLEKLCIDAESIIGGYIQDVEYLGQYLNRNYKVPRPNSPDSPARVDEVFDIVNDDIIIKEVSYSDNIFVVALNYFNRDNNRITIARGSTGIKKGYAFLSESVSNSNPVGTINFLENEEEGKGKFLFEYRIDSQDNINIVSSSGSLVKFRTGWVNHINHLSIGSRVYLPYTATDYEAIIVLGKKTNMSQSVKISINGNISSMSEGGAEKMYAIVYLKPGDKLTASVYDKAYKVIYDSV